MNLISRLISKYNRVKTLSLKRAILLNEKKRLANQALNNLGKSSKKEVVRIQRIEEILRLSKNHKWRKYFRLFLFSVMCISVVISNYCKVSKTDIELNMEISAIDLRIGKEQLITDQLNLESVQLDRVKYEKKLSEFKELIEPKSDDFNQNFEIIPISNNERAGSLNLASIIARKNSKLSFRKADGLNSYILEITPVKSKFKIAVKDSIKVLGSQPKQQLFSPFYSKIVFKCDSIGGGAIKLSTSEKLTSIFPKTLEVAGIKLTDKKDVEGNKNNEVITTSFIHSGKLYYRSLKDKEYILRPKQLIKLNEALGKFEFLEFKNGNLIVFFSGSVKGITSGVGENSIDLMPTYLQWLLEQGPFKDLLAAIAVILTFLALIKAVIKQN